MLSQITGGFNFSQKKGGNFGGFLKIIYDDIVNVSSQKRDQGIFLKNILRNLNVVKKNAIVLTLIATTI